MKVMTRGKCGGMSMKILVVLVGSSFQRRW